jgi:hypothetical protein
VDIHACRICNVLRPKSPSKSPSLLLFSCRVLCTTSGRAGMPKSMLPFVVLGFVLTPGTALAVDECLSKPNAPAPKGQHWYYRIDRANNNRQCWRLGPEGLRVHRSEPQIQKNKSQAAVQPEPPPPTQRPATIGMAIASADASAVGAAGTAPSTGWLDVTNLRIRRPLPSRRRKRLSNRRNRPLQAMPSHKSLIPLMVEVRFRRRALTTWSPNRSQRLRSPRRKPTITQ